MRLVTIIGILLSVYTSVWACDCGSKKPELKREFADTADLIVLVRIDSVHIDGLKSTAFATGTSLFKGIVGQSLQFEFDGISACRVPFAPSETWLVYAQSKSGKGWKVHYCSRTRKLTSANETDDFTAWSGTTWDEELKFIKTNFPQHDFLAPEEVVDFASEEKIVLDARRDLAHADNTQKIILLAISLGGMMIIYIFVKKFWK